MAAVSTVGVQAASVHSSLARFTTILSTGEPLREVSLHTPVTPSHERRGVHRVSASSGAAARLRHFKKQSCFCLEPAFEVVAFHESA